jgi:Type I restriction enzyme R protein N terminus (HSDR_N)
MVGFATIQHRSWGAKAMPKATMENDAFSRLSAVIADAANRNRNEAETRHKIIDFILHDLLAWPRNRVAVEENIHPGFADYILKKTNGEPLVFVEAKKEGLYFELPLPHNADETSSYISIKKLLTDSNIKAAANQVRTYCGDTGCEYACITNGHEWIFFKTFEKNVRWDSLNALVIRRLEFFEREYTRAVNSLSFLAITERSALPGILSSMPPRDRSLFYPKEKIAAYSHSITANKFANKLRPIANIYFGVISDNDTEFMTRCYVSDRDYASTYAGMRTLIHDSLSPYFQQFGVQQLDDAEDGGKLRGRLEAGLQREQRGEVLVLFGGKGSGKSTFIKRLLHHKPPAWLGKHSVIAIVDLLTTPEEHSLIDDFVWMSIIKSLDTDSVMQADRDTLLEQLFQDRFEVAKKQTLAGLDPASPTYNLQLADLISQWKEDYVYCATRLMEYWKKRRKGIVVALDNTDQYSSEGQDFCFQIAQDISKRLQAITLISMREERFHNSKIHGLLDAFQNSGFHISSPKPAAVFAKRLQYTIDLLKSGKGRAMLMADVDVETVKEIRIYLDILAKDFATERSPLNAFLTACGHGDIRLSLDLFRSFLLSGYTNVEEMVATRSWVFQLHQVIKPVMIPKRYFYDETLSDIPNIFQIRHNRHGSHFTALRILRKLAKATEGSTPAYMNVAELLGYFADTFNMADDFTKTVDLLLKHGLVESNNRVDQYSEDVDQIKITNYGMYMFNMLGFEFTYLDLVCTDCGIFDEGVSNYLSQAARVEYGYFLKHQSLKRVEIRLERVESFNAYLRSEELREREMYSLGMPDAEMFTSQLLATFNTEKDRIKRSAKKQQIHRKILHGRGQ